jgi:hypothetical protein
MDDEAVVDFKGLREQFGITYTRSHIKRLEDARKFPKRGKAFEYRNSHPYWRVREIREWLKGLWEPKPTKPAPKK